MLYENTALKSLVAGAHTAIFRHLVRRRGPRHPSHRLTAFCIATDESIIAHPLSPASHQFWGHATVDLSPRSGVGLNPAIPNLCDTRGPGIDWLRGDW